MDTPCVLLPTLSHSESGGRVVSVKVAVFDCSDNMTGHPYRCGGVSGAPLDASVQANGIMSRDGG